MCSAADMMHVVAYMMCDAANMMHGVADMMAEGVIIICQTKLFYQSHKRILQMLIYFGFKDPWSQQSLQWKCLLFGGIWQPICN